MDSAYDDAAFFGQYAAMQRSRQGFSCAPLTAAWESGSKCGRCFPMYRAVIFSTPAAAMAGTAATPPSRGRCKEGGRCCSSKRKRPGAR